ncbi:type II toxin-antitoxin system VapB family antitoxin [Actinopolymorpha sp. B9G3]|uniref:type II toxin-antitoxin system VapB family antitoxin n=1 Tax=Actinopolymorpha sp. B9G3 TaxID=3158970 RepID=UPI0032D99C5E
MTKTLIDVDDDLLAQAAEALGTGTKKDTVNKALAEALASVRRRRHLERLMGGGLPDLSDPEVMEGAWG